MSTTSHTMSTAPSELGQLGAEGMRDLLRRATGGAPIATYAEGDPPIGWEVLAAGGWDVIGVPDGEDGASLRDLVEIVRWWGRACVQQPLVPSLLAKRHSATAAAHDGPVTMGLPLVGTTAGYVPFGGTDGIVVTTGLGAGTDQLVPVPAGEPDTLGLTMQGVETDLVTTLSPTAAREIAVLLAAEATGGAERLLADSIIFASGREQFGRPVGSFQAVKHHVANAAIAAEVAETAVIWAAERPDEAFRGALFAVERSIDVAELAIQVHGGLGFTWEMGLHFPLRQMLKARELVAGLETTHGR
jgi:hypothetical protein